MKPALATSLVSEGTSLSGDLKFEKELVVSDTFKNASKMIGELVPSLLEFVPKYRSSI